MKKRWALLAVTPLAVFAIASMLLPFGLVFEAAKASPAPAGFGRGARELLDLALRSLVLAAIPAAAASGVGLALGVGARFVPSFRDFYRIWLLGSLFVNPVLLVVVFSVILVRFQPDMAVLLASTYLVLPFTAFIIQAGIDSYPEDLVLAARSLGARPVFIICTQILPAALSSVVTAVLFASFYALGFFLLPAHVGLGRVVTLGTSIDTAANRVGDWAGAVQLSCITLLLQAVLLGLGFWFQRVSTRSSYA